MAESTETQKELIITRVFDAPRERVWRAWTDPELFKRWWGPENFSSPVAEMDLRVGGKYLACMRSPDGQNYWSTGEYREIVPLERLVYTDAFADEKGQVVPASHYGMDPSFPRELLVTVTFEDLDGKTRMTLSHAGMPEGEMKEMTGLGWQTSFDKLAKAVERSHATKWTYDSDLQVTVERIFDAPRELVFRVYTEPQFIPKWWGPGYLKTAVDHADVRPGGSYRYIQTDPDGNRYVFFGDYLTVIPPERLVSTFQWDGAPGHTITDDATFENLTGRTRLRIVSRFSSIEARDAMLQGGDMEEGANETYDRLAQLLAELAGEKA